MSNETTERLLQLLEMMATLRDPSKGCPWDRAQTFASIVPHTLEEAYEVADVIERQALAELPDELGDLFYQILFYCQMAKEQQLFTLKEVFQALTEKLIRRHPHVFAGETARSWEEIKQTEKNSSTILSSIPQPFPALSGAQKLQNRAARVGFDWPSVQPVIAKLKEEIAEFEEAFAANAQAAMQEELGDILFVCANLARHAKCDAEQTLRLANQKFTRRFNGVEAQVNASGKAWQDFSLEELEAFWQTVKATEKVSS